MANRFRQRINPKDKSFAVAVLYIDDVEIHQW